jgi:predicted nucleic acid-binding protein
MKRIYLDSNILIAYYSSEVREQVKHEILEKALAVFSQIRDVQLCTSLWAITETVNILISSHRMDPGTVAQLEDQLIHEKRLQRLKVALVNVSSDPTHDFDEFFFHVRQAILSYHSGVGDVIHSVIMKNNGIDTILTFDEKNDFKQIPGLTVLHPKDVKI